MSRQRNALKNSTLKAERAAHLKRVRFQEDHIISSDGVSTINEKENDDQVKDESPTVCLS